MRKAGGGWFDDSPRGGRETQSEREREREASMRRRVGMSLRKSTTDRRMEKRSGRKRNNVGKRGREGGVRGNGGGGKQRNGEVVEERERGYWYFERRTEAKDGKKLEGGERRTKDRTRAWYSTVGATQVEREAARRGDEKARGQGR